MEVQPAKWHKSISTLPLWCFVEVQTTGNLYALAISGTPDERDLQISWNRISVEYHDRIGGADHTHYINTFKESVLLNTTLKQIELVIISLEVANNNKVWYEPLYTELNKLLHASLKFSSTDFTKNAQNLKRAKNMSRGLKMRCDLTAQRLEELTKKEDTNKPTPEYYQSILITLSDHNHYPITDKITVYEFCERLRRLNLYVKKLNRNYNGY